jgi:prevent-host-death family protein
MSRTSPRSPLRVSKSRLKARALEYFREVERTGDEIVVTDHGRPVLRIIRYTEEAGPALQVLRGTLRRYERPTEPVASEDWEGLAR